MPRSTIYHALKVFSVAFIGLLFTSSGCTAQKKKGSQGISGTVLWRSGNLMPSPDVKVTNPKGSPIAREILIYELTSSNQTEPADDAGFYRKINSKFIQKITTNKAGRFKVTLPAGYYSLFTKEDKGLYANLFDDAMNINPVQVRKGKWEKIEIIIDYAAVY